MKTKSFLLCAMLLLAAAPAPAQDADPLERHFFPPELVMQHQRTIGLTAAQKETIKTAVQTAQATFTDVQWQLHDEMQAMGELISNARVDQTQVLDQLEDILALERQIKRAQLTLMVHIKNTLTAEQQQQLNDIRFADAQPGDGGWPW